MRGQSEQDWAVLDLEGVREVALQAARRVNRKYERFTELDDLKQDALIFIATRADLQEVARDGELGLLQYRLEADLVDSIKYDSAHQAQTISYTRIEEEGDETFVRPYVAIETASNDYSRESVESLLPAVWDETYLYGLPKRDNAPDPDMPKGSSNKAHGNNLSAYIADIKTGWQRTPLTLKEKRAVFMAYALHWTQREIAAHEGVSQQAIQQRLYTAIGKIVARLNGGIWSELEAVEA